MSEEQAEHMIYEGGPTAHEEPPASDEPEPVATPTTPDPPLFAPAYPGEGAFYAGAKGAWLDQLRRLLEVAVPDGQENAGFREHDATALREVAGTANPSRRDWAEVFGA